MNESMTSEINLYAFWGKHRPRASAVWEYFGFKKNENGELVKAMAYCKFCLKGLSYSGNTTNIMGHLYRHHPHVKFEVRQPKIRKYDDPTLLAEGDDTLDYDNAVGADSTSADNYIEDKEKEHPIANSLEMSQNSAMKTSVLPENLSRTIYAYHGKHKNESSTSVVWSYFGFKKTENGELFKMRCFCRLCGKDLAYNGSTTNMLNHLSRFHPETGVKGCSHPTRAFTERTPKNLLTFPNVDPVELEIDPELVMEPRATIVQQNQAAKKAMACSSNFSRVKGKGRQKEITNAIATYAAKDMISLDTLSSSSGFQQLVAVLDPTYSFTGVDLYSDKIEEMYTSEESKMRQNLHEISGGALTVENWTDPSKCKQYLSVGINFVSKSWKLVTGILNTVALADDDQNTISECIQNILVSWGLSEAKLTAVVGTNDSIRSALRDIDQSYVGCLGDIVNHAVINAMNNTEIKDTIHNVSETCRFFQSNTGLLELFKQISRENFPNSGQECNFPSSDATSWCDLYKMLSDIHKIKRQLNKLFSQAMNIEDIDIVQESDWDVINDVLKVLGPLYQITQSLCTEGNPTASSVLPILFQLQDVGEPSLNDSEFVNSMKLAIKNTIENAGLYRDNTMRDILFLSTVLDPRFKSLWFLTEKEKNRVYKQLTSSAMDMDGGNAESNDDDEPPPVKKIKSEFAVEENQEENDDEVTANDVNDMPKGLASLFGRRETPKQPNPDPLSGPEMEVDLYKDEEQLAMDSDPFVWWSGREGKYPLLSRLARQYLCLPACASPPQLLFTKAGQVFSYKRLALAQQHLDKRLFLYKVSNQ